MPNQHTGKNPRNAAFHEWFYSKPSRGKHAENSTFYTIARLAWEEVSRRTKHNIQVPTLNWKRP